MAIALERGNPAREQNPAYGLLQPIFIRNGERWGVDDQQLWNRALAEAFRRYDKLAGDVRERLDGQIGEIMRLKQELYDLALTAGSPRLCRECGGKCCLNGKYHVTVLDLLAYRSAGSEPVVPDFSNAPFCPYGDPDGCLMPPPFRSMTCLLFNCDAIEERWGNDTRERFAARERALRDTIGEAERTLRYRAGRAALLSCG